MALGAAKTCYIEERRGSATDHKHTRIVVCLRLSPVRHFLRQYIFLPALSAFTAGVKRRAAPLS